MLLEDVKQKTEHIFEQKICLPEPPQIWKDKLLALEEAALPKQKASLIFDMRRLQAKELGFEEIESDKLVEMIMGEPHTKIQDSTEKGSIKTERQTYEWVYNHHTDEELLKSNWGGEPIVFERREEKKKVWYVPPFLRSDFKKWIVIFGKLDYLKKEIPYGVVLKINECKKLKLFNVFNVVAPEEAWERKTDIDPIVVASIWEMPIDETGGFLTAGRMAHFFLAQW